MTNKKLIFDLGFHNGDDTDFYLKKGFGVVALEADPALVRAGMKRFKKYIADGRLVLINKAVSGKNGKINFYIHPNKTDWSSCDRTLAEIDGSKSKTVYIESISFTDLCKEFGTPLYAKVDIEGQDIVVARELYGLKVKPTYVSFETSKQTYDSIFSWLCVSGYKSFQLINQLNHPSRKIEPSKQIEGKKINYKFSKYSSGFFGKDLPKDRWLSFDEALTRYLKYKELKIIDNQELALGWLDIHARL